MTSDRIDFAGAQVEPYLWFGWSAPDPKSRWTEERSAGIVFRLTNESLQRDQVLKMQLSGFIVPVKHRSQKVIATLNGTTVDSFLIAQTEPIERTIKLPASLLRAENELILKLPDAASPKSFGLSKDPRQLGIA